MRQKLTTLSETKPEAKWFAGEEVTTEIFIFFNILFWVFIKIISKSVKDLLEIE